MGRDGVVDELRLALRRDGSDGLGEVGGAGGVPIVGVPEGGGLPAAEAEGAADDGGG